LVLPATSAQADAIITWSGYVRAGAVYQNTRQENDKRKFDWGGDKAGWVPDASYQGDSDHNVGVISVKTREQVRVTAASPTAAGEVGVDIRLRGNFNGNGAAPIYSDVAWGYWNLTRELTFGSGYDASLGKIGTGLNGDCVCYYTDNSAISLDPGDVTQLRLSYSSGPFKIAAAVEDASFRGKGNDYKSDEVLNGDRLGAAGKISFSADEIYGEISGVWRDYRNYEDIYNIHALWQLGAGLRLPLGGIADLSFAAAYGQGPVENTYEGEIVSGSARNNSWWAVSALASAEVADHLHAEIGAGFMARDLDRYVDRDGNYTNGGDGNQWTALSGLYYTPVSQFTVGIEGEWIETRFSDVVFDYGPAQPHQGQKPDYKFDVDVGTTSFTIDLVSVWRF
jgi:hypothetical protein